MAERFLLVYCVLFQYEKFTKLTKDLKCHDIGVHVFSVLGMWTFLHGLCGCNAP